MKPVKYDYLYRHASFDAPVKKIKFERVINNKTHPGIVMTEHESGNNIIFDYLGERFEMNKAMFDLMWHEKEVEPVKLVKK